MVHNYPNRSNYNASKRILQNKKDGMQPATQLHDIFNIEKSEEPQTLPDKSFTPQEKTDIKKEDNTEKENINSGLTNETESRILKKEFKMPNISKIVQKAKEETIMSKQAINFGIVGLGQCGGRMAEVFESLGYPTIAINTSEQDLEGVNCKIKLPIGSGGAGKDLKIGAEAINRNRQQIMEAYRKEFKSVDHILICAGSSGGTGGGGLAHIISTVRDLKKPVGVLTTFPLETEDTRAKKNTLSVLNELIKLNGEKKVRPLILIDNDKIEKKHPGLSTLEFWTKANEEVVKTFDIFNKLAAKSTKYTSLDPADYAKIMTSGGCMIFGNIVTPMADDSSDLSEIYSKAISANINSGLLAEGFNLVEATHCGCIIAANSGDLKKIPRKAEENAMALLMEIIGSGSVYRGVYGLDSLTSPEVFFMLSGLTLPVQRIRNLIQNVKTETEHLVEKTPTKTVIDIMNELGEGEGIDLDNVGVDAGESK